MKADKSMLPGINLAHIARSKKKHALGMSKKRVKYVKDGISCTHWKEFYPFFLAPFPVQFDMQIWTVAAWETVNLKINLESPPKALFSGLSEREKEKVHISI